jgi:hypothetical protein
VVMLEGGHSSGKVFMRQNIYVRVDLNMWWGNGKKTRFWHEVCLGECPLKIRFNKLFEICKQQNWEVARVLQGGVINLTFRRNFGNVEILE